MPPEIVVTAPEPGDLPDVPRPREQPRLVGHEPALSAFAGALRADRLHHAWLIGGPRGIGKATLAYRVARYLAADPRLERVSDDLAVPADHPATRQVAALSHPNLVSLRRVAAPGAKAMPTRIGVDVARKALDLFASTAGTAGYRVCIVDSAEDLNANSANALLKMIEEPPPRSLFLIVSHAPGRLLPTIRSRCRALTLRPLEPEQVRAVIEGFPPPFEPPAADVLARAAARGEGSVARTLSLLDKPTLALVDETETLLSGLGNPDWRRILKLAETLAAREAEERFETFLDTVLGFLHAEIDRRRDEGAASLLRLVEAAERIGTGAREAAVYNLDRRPLVLTIFGELAGPGLQRP